ncbi:MAG: rod shape-determining protein RodA [Candidatus Eiseniibacteriota bacterium]
MRRTRARRRMLEREQIAVLLSGLLLSLGGVLLIYSAVTGSPFATLSNHHWRQLTWLGIALVSMCGAIAIPFTVYDGARVYVIWGLSLALLVLVMVIGTSGLGAQRWLVLGGIRVQPSEIAKLATIFALARFLAARRRSPRRMRDLVGAGVLTAVPTALVLQQPDLGTSLVFPAILCGMLYWAGLPFPYLLLLVSPVVSMVAAVSALAWGLFALGLVLTLAWAYRSGLGAALVVLALGINLAVGIATPKLWGSLEEYQQQRITAFLNPGKDRYGAGYQLIQSEIAIGSGGMGGQGFLHGTQKNFQFLPEKHTDFIFSVAGEELGLRGCAAILLAYTVLLLAGIEIARSVRSRFASLVAFGIVVMISFHVAINIAMTVGFAPVTGLPLPFLSYGGSSLAMNLTALGLLAGIGMRRHEY